jgi:hypothetical protein
VLLYTLSQWREIAGLFGRREARYGSLALTSVFVVLGIIIAINYIGVRQNKRWDLTADKQFSLSDQSHKAIAALDAPLEALVFTQEYDFPRFQDLLNEYQYASKLITTQASIRQIRPSRQKREAAGRCPELQGAGERVTSDFDRTSPTDHQGTSGQQRAVYFTQGHEKDPLGPISARATAARGRAQERELRLKRSS